MTIPIARSYDVGTVLTLALRKFLTRKVIAQNYTHPATLRLFERESQMKTDSAGYWHIPVQNIGSALGGEFDGGDSTSTLGVDDTTYAQYRRKWYAEPIKIFKTDVWDTGGGEALLRIGVHRQEAAIKRLAQLLNTDCTATTQTTTKKLTPIPVLIPVNPATGTVGGIDRSQESWYRSKTDSSSPSFASDGPTTMEAMARTVSLNNGYLNFDYIMTDPTTFGYMQAKARAFLNFFSTPQAGTSKIDWGTTVYFHNKPVYFDSALPAGRIYFMNRSAFKQHTVPGVDFLVDKPTALAAGGQHGEIMYVYWGGENVLYNPSECGQISTVAA